MNNVKTWLKAATTTALLIIAFAVAIGCSDDGEELSLDEYFRQVDAVDNGTDERINALFEAITDENDVAQFRNAMNGFGPILEDAADDLDDIDPPDEAAAEHEALVDALRDWAAAAGDAVDSDGAANAASPDELFVAFEEGGFGAAQNTFSAACQDLQDIATNAGIDVDINCDDEEGEIDGAEQTVRDIAAAWNASDVPAFAAFFTDAGLNSAFGQGEEAPREELVAGLEGQVGVGAIEIQEIERELTDAGADVTVLWVSGYVLENLRFSLLLEDDAWKVDAVEDLGPVPAPTGTAVVDVDMDEFSFTFDAGQITSSAPFALRANNVGEQEHHVVIMKIPADANVDELLAAEGDPPGVESIAGMPPVAPGANASIVFAKPLDSGRYLFVCFLPDAANPEGPPHAFSGMTSDFTVE